MIFRVYIWSSLIWSHILSNRLWSKLLYHLWIGSLLQSNISNLWKIEIYRRAKKRLQRLWLHFPCHRLQSFLIEQRILYRSGVVDLWQLHSWLSSCAYARRNPHFYRTAGFARRPFALISSQNRPSFDLFQSSCWIWTQVGSITCFYFLRARLYFAGKQHEQGRE